MEPVGSSDLLCLADMVDDSFASLCSELDRIRSSPRQTQWDGWYSGTDGDNIFEDATSGVQIFVSDLYTAMNPLFLRPREIG